MSGDMADFALDQVMDMEDMRLDFRMGHLSYQDSYNNGVIDELGFEARASTSSSSKSCKHCGESGLVWRKHETGWRLSYASGGVHSCKEHKF